MSDIKTRIFAFDFLKVISCFAVVALHCTMRFDCLPLYYMWGYAVPVFFMVNGALILKRVINNTVDSKYFIIKTLRIFLLILVWNFMFTLYDFIVFKSPFSFFTNLYLIYTGSNPRLAPMWFLFALMFIYFFMALFTKKINSSKTVNILCISLFLICFLLRIINNINCFFNNSDLYEMLPSSARIIKWLFYFLFGHILTSFIQANKDRFNLKVILILVIVTAVLFISYIKLMVVFGFLPNRSAPSLSFSYNSVFGVLFCSSVFSVGFFIKENKLLSKIVYFLNPLLIGVYIFHYYLVYIVSKFLTKIFIDMFSEVVIYNLSIIPTFLISVLISYIIYKIPYVNKLIKI